MVCRPDSSTAQNGPCAPGGAGFLRGAGPAQPEGPRPIVGAEVSGLRSTVQGATSGLPGPKRWAVFNQGMQALGFFFLSSFLPWQREGLMGMGIQVDKRA